MTTLTATRMVGGVWEGVLRAPGPAPGLAVTHQGRAVPGLTVAGGDGEWTIRVPVPVEAIADGVQTFVIADAATGEALASFAVVAGEPLAEDLRAEIDLLRAELDMLKRAFRRHCLESGA